MFPYFEHNIHAKTSNEKKGSLYFSHRLDLLASQLIVNLYSFQSEPFERRLILVPDSRLKPFLLSHIIQSPLQIAAGIDIISLHAFTDLLREESSGFIKKIPSQIELSLSVQYEIITIVEEAASLSEEEKSLFTPISQYIKQHPQRLYSLSDEISKALFYYSSYAQSALREWLCQRGWMQSLYRRIFDDKSPWTSVADFFIKAPKLKEPIHLFGFAYIPSAYLLYFATAWAHLYLFSPSKVFWAEPASGSDKLQKKYPLFSIDDHVEMEHPLLASLGKLSKKFFFLTDELGFDVKEHYPEIENGHLLAHVQRTLLHAEVTPCPVPAKEDRSVELLSAPSLIRELEMIKDSIIKYLKKGGLPSDILVLAPDINDYVPFIHAVFGSLELPIEYRIKDLDPLSTDPLAHAFLLLMSLAEEKCSVSSVIKLFSLPIFREKWGWSIEDLQLIETWIQQARIHADIDEKSPDYSHSWDVGLNRLLLGLAQVKHDIWMPLLSVELSQIELFNQFLEIICSLKEDLTFLEEPTELTFSEWVHYFSCLAASYFSIPESHDLLKSLRSLEKSMKVFSKNKVDFPGVKRILEKVLSQKKNQFQSSHLEAITFASLTAGNVVPSSIIILIGMQEGAFPRRSAEYFIDADFLKSQGALPSQIDEDRDLFLRTIHQAKKALILSYCRLSDEDQSQLHPSIVIEELYHCLERLCPNNLPQAVHHPFHAFSEDYFISGSELNTFSTANYLASKAKQNIPSDRSPFLKELYLPHSIPLSVSSEPLTIDIESIRLFARHPIRYFCERVLKMKRDHLKFDEDTFVLPKYLAQKLLKQSMHSSLEDVWLEAQKKCEVPTGFFGELGFQNLVKEKEEYTNVYSASGISEISTLELKPGCKALQQIESDYWVAPPLELRIDGISITITGTLPSISLKGMVTSTENSLDEVIKLWPLYLIYLNLIENSPFAQALLFLEEEKSLHFKGDPCEALQAYLRYYLIGQQFASPLMPEWTKPLLDQDEERLEKAIQQKMMPFYEEYKDEWLSWLFIRDGLPTARILLKNWSPVFKTFITPYIFDLV